VEIRRSIGMGTSYMVTPSWDALRWRRCLVQLLLGCGVAAQALAVSADTAVRPAEAPHSTVPASMETVRLEETYGRRPLSFEANQGQVNSQVQFLTRGAGYQLFLTPTEAVLALRQEQRASERDARDERDASGKSAKGEISPGQVSGVRSQVSGFADQVSGDRFLVSGSDQSPAVKTQTPRPDTGHPTPDFQPAVLRMKLAGANASPQVLGLEKQEGIVNYFIGNDPAKWRTNIPTYGKVQYKDVYAGVDLVYYGTNQRQMEYDFVVAPGADPKQIALTFEGADGIELDAQGDLTLTLPSPSKGEGPPKSPRPADGERVGVRGRSSEGEGAVTTEPSVLRLKKPIVYQVIDGQRHELDGRYVLSSKWTVPQMGPRPSRASGVSRLSRLSRSSRPTKVGFAVAAYDPTLPLIIDPVLTYSTYLGGTGNDQGNAIAVDGSGNAYVTGETNSTNFPINFPGGPSIPIIQASNGGGGDAFVTKFGPTGAQIYSTYLGGGSDDQGRGIAVDGAGQAYVTGSTGSVNFPIRAAPGTPAPFDSASNGGTDAFVSKLSADGLTLVFSTYLGGVNTDVGTGIAVESVSPPRVFVAGWSHSVTIDGVSPIIRLNPASAGRDAFATRLSADGTAVQQFFFIGGGANDQATAIAVDASANMYVTGDTNSSDFPTTAPLGAQPFQAQYSGPFNFSFPLNTFGGDAFVVKLSAAGDFVYGSFLGGDFFEFGQGIAVDSAGQAILMGETASPNFPTVTPLQAQRRGASDLFVTKVNASGTALLFSTFLGGSSKELSRGIARDASDNIYVLGRTESEDFPVTADAFRRQAFVFIGDIVLAKLSPMGTSVLYGTYFGGSLGGVDDVFGLAVDAAGTVYLTGKTGTTDFPVAHPFQASLSGSTDAFVAKVGAACGPGSVDLRVTQADDPDPLPSLPGVTQELVYTITVANLGPATATGVRLYDLLSEDVILISVTPAQGSCAQNAGFITCALGGIAAGSEATVTLTVGTHAHPILTNWAQAVSAECDPNPTNNATVETTTVSSVTPVFFTLTVTKEGEEVISPAISSVNRPGINCGVDCSEVYPSGSVVRLSYPDQAPGNFLGFFGNRDCRDGILIMTGNRTCLAAFSTGQGSNFSGNFGAGVAVGSSAVLPFFDNMPNPSLSGAVDMTVSTSPPLSIEGTSTFHLAPGQSLRDVAPAVMIRFTPILPGGVNGTLRFSWSGPGATPGFTVPMQFTAVATGTGVAVGVQVTGNGKVTGTGIACGTDQDGAPLGDCGEVSSDPQLTLFASANPGWAFHSWKGCTATAGTQCTATPPHSVKATFRALPVKKTPPPRTPRPQR